LPLNAPGLAVKDRSGRDWEKKKNRGKEEKKKGYADA
jgi:hypothetical protein